MNREDGYICNLPCERHPKPFTLEAAVAWCEENGLDIERVQVSYKKPQSRRCRVVLWWVKKPPIPPLNFEATAPTFRAALIAAVEQAKGETHV